VCLRTGWARAGSREAGNIKKDRGRLLSTLPILTAPALNSKGRAPQDLRAFRNTPGLMNRLQTQTAIRLSSGIPSRASAVSAVVSMHVDDDYQQGQALVAAAA
jgi:hypothetical protein